MAVRRAEPFSLRLARFVCGVLLLAVTGTTVVGYQAILPMLLDAGVYASLCPHHASLSSGGGHSTTPLCIEQQLRLDAMYVTSILLLNVMGFPWALFIGRHGPRVTTICGALLAGIGAVMFAVSSDALQLWAPGYCIIGAAAGGIVWPVFGLVELFPANKGTAQSFVNGAMDASSAVFLLFQPLFYSLHLSLPTLFFGFAAVVVGLGVIAAFYAHGGVTADGDDGEGAALIEAGGADDDDDADADERPLGPNGMFADGMSQCGLLKTRQMVIATAFLTFMISTKYFYFTNLNEMALWTSGGDEAFADLAALAFSIAQPLSVVFAVIAGPLIDRGGLPLSIAVLTLTTAALGVTSVVKTKATQWIAVALYSFSRYFLFVVAPRVFSVLFGRDNTYVTYGIALIVGGAGIGLSYFATSLVETHLSGVFTIPNLAFCAACALAGAILASRMRAWRRNYNRCGAP